MKTIPYVIADPLTHGPVRLNCFCVFDYRGGGGDFGAQGETLAFEVFVFVSRKHNGGITTPIPIHNLGTIFACVWHWLTRICIGGLRSGRAPNNIVVILVNVTNFSYCWCCDFARLWSI